MVKQINQFQNIRKKRSFKKPDIATNIAINEEKTSATLEKLVNKLLNAIKSSSNLLIKNTQITNSAKSYKLPQIYQSCITTYKSFGML